MTKYKLGVAIPYYKQNKLCEQLFNYLYEIIKLELYYESLEDEIKVIVYENNIGLPAARNKIMEELIRECEYITFIDSDDRISINYFGIIYEYLMNTDFDIYMTDFYINNSKTEFQALQNHVTGVIYNSELIKDIRFNENRNVGEDMEFNQEVRKLNPTTCKIPCIYYYNYGANKDCLSYRFARGELKEFKDGDLM